MTAVGVDACKTGWIAVSLGEAGAEAHFLPSIDKLAGTIMDATAVAVDIPIGLVDVGLRAADLDGRRHLGRRASSLFVMPPRTALEEPTYAGASSRCRELAGRGVSRQAYGLAAKVFEVEKWLPDAPCGVWEAHPELSFSLLVGRPASFVKKTWAGMQERRKALKSAGIDLDDAAGEAAGRSAVDDMLDAGVLAWTAKRVVDGVARSFPDPPPSGDTARPVAIWA